MKTDLVEIFQTLRASAQPYTAMGFAARKNSEDAFELFTEKIVDNTPEDGVFFAGIIIKGQFVEFCLFPTDLKEPIDVKFKPQLTAILKDGCFRIDQLDDLQLANIEEALSEGFKAYKEKGWV